MIPKRKSSLRKNAIDEIIELRLTNDIFSISEQ